MPNLSVSVQLGIDWRVTLFSFALATATGLACGVAPAWTATRLDLSSTIGRDRIGSAPRLRARSVFVVAQVALSVLLVVSALLLARSIRHAAHIDPGFRVDGVEVVGLDFRLGGYDDTRGRILAEELMSRIERLPGVASAASARVVPLTREREGGRFWLPGEEGPERAIDGSVNIVTAGFFRTLGLAFVAGRNFEATDRAGAPSVAIVNETLARQAWPGQECGRQADPGGQEPLPRGHHRRRPRCEVPHHR